MPIGFRKIEGVVPSTTGTFDLAFTQPAGLSPIVAAALKAAIVIQPRAVVDSNRIHHSVVSIGLTDGTNQVSRQAFGDHNQNTSATSQRGSDVDIAMSYEADGTERSVTAFDSFIQNGIKLDAIVAAGADTDRIYALTFHEEGGSSDLEAFVGTGITNGEDVAVSIDDAGFEPDVVLFIAGGSVFNETISNECLISIGWARNDGSATEIQHCITLADLHNSATTSIESRFSDIYALERYRADTNPDSALEVTDWRANGFEVTLRETSGSGTPTEISFGYLALKFNDAIEHDIGRETTPTSTGTQAFTGPGFAPEMIGPCIHSIMNSSPATGAEAGGFGIGVDLRVGDVHATSISTEDNAARSDTSSRNELTQVICLDDDNGSSLIEADPSSFDSSGWTWDFTAVAGSARSFVYAALGRDGRSGVAHGVGVTSAFAVGTVTGGGPNPVTAAALQTSVTSAHAVPRVIARPSASAASVAAVNGTPRVIVRPTAATTSITSQFAAPRTIVRPTAATTSITTQFAAPRTIVRPTASQASITSQVAVPSRRVRPTAATASITSQFAVPRRRVHSAAETTSVSSVFSTPHIIVRPTAAQVSIAAVSAVPRVIVRPSASAAALASLLAVPRTIVRPAGFGTGVASVFAVSKDRNTAFMASLTVAFAVPRLIARAAGFNVSLSAPDAQPRVIVRPTAAQSSVAAVHGVPRVIVRPAGFNASVAAVNAVGFRRVFATAATTSLTAVHAVPGRRVFGIASNAGLASPFAISSVTPQVNVGFGVGVSSAFAVFTFIGGFRARTFGVGVTAAHAFAQLTKICPEVSTALDLRMVPKALELITKLGRTVIFHLEATETYDPATGQTVKSGETTFSAISSPPLSYTDDYIDGQTIRRGDLQLIIPDSGLTFAPDQAQKVTIDGVDWTIMQVVPVYSGNDVAVWTLQLRGGQMSKLGSTTVQNALDSRLPQTVSRLLNRFGRNAIFEVADARTFDPTVGGNPEQGFHQHCEKIVLEESKSDARAFTHSTDYLLGKGTSIGYNIKAHASAQDLSFVPYKAMKVTFAGESWDVVSVEATYTGGKIALWTMELTR